LTENFSQKVDEIIGVLVHSRKHRPRVYCVYW